MYNKIEFSKFYSGSYVTSSPEFNFLILLVLLTFLSFLISEEILNVPSSSVTKLILSSIK